MSETNPSIAAVTEEIRVREQELEALRAALTVLQSDRQPQVHIATGRNGQLVISNIFVDDGNGAVQIVTDSDPRSEDRAAVVREKGRAAAGRQRTATVLTFFDRQTAKSLKAVATEAGVEPRWIAIGVLTKHGYLKPKGNGYVRTAKVYEP